MAEWDAETRIKALAEFLECDEEDIVESKYGDNHFEHGSGKYPPEYLVVTDNEADILWDEFLDNYLDECVLPELPEHLRLYFDDEKWKEDARMDDRGQSLSSYDGCEYEVEVEDENGKKETLFIYRLF